ncbi:NAD-dependent succinate-semialdehyde dehydrogenase [Croceicoccus estronivorus]|uniref:NAD-dependent succinate-semialdehyde dehydrogenase n=1 Tax=Croceicoccus estronivorus TaxID=1172626 RepID=UPI00082A4E65|nr:NAD-dependent succinate-semialdehyde dehydrogenase [Croceicoccus estronivorus]OCC22501.1 NAD-dependent succinate-semialdehyde dehydrogenase [Croceicoccus estronivorus]
MYPAIQFLIDGTWRDGVGDAEPVLNPATGASLGDCPMATAQVLDEALAAAEAAFKSWRKTAAIDRARIMGKASDLLRERADRVAEVLTLEQGKPIGEARTEVIYAADVIEWYAEECKRTYGRIVPGRVPGTRQLVMQEPVGVVAAFSPWNFPALTPIRKIAGAIAAGCSIIIKPSEETPGTCVEMARCFVEAGLPDGVLNVVFGQPAFVSEHLMKSDTVRKISFTGSVPVGKLLMRQAADTLKRTTLELGGHAPVIVFDDVDVEKTVQSLVAGKFRNGGQVCVSPTRFYIQQDIYEPFAARFAELASAWKVGPGIDPESQMGPLANPRRVDAMEDFVRDAREAGGKLLTGGSKLGNQGFFFQPTVIKDLPDTCKLMTDEPFGPIAPIVPFRTFDEVIERANALPFGLASYAFTRSLQTSQAVSDAIEAGMMGINTLAISTPETPFGGVKYSGHGREGGIEGLEAYMNLKFVASA